MHHLYIVPSSFVVGQSEKCIPKILERNVNVVLWQRDLTQFFSGWTSEIRWNKVHEIHSEMGIEELDDFETSLSNEVGHWVKRSPDFNEWFVSDILGITRSFFQKTGAEKVVLRLSQNVPEGHQYSNDCLRLLCVYAGPNLFVKMNGRETEVEKLVDHLDVLLLKGSLWPMNDNGSAEYSFTGPHASNENIILELIYKY